MTWDIGAYEFGAAIPVPPDPLPIPDPIADVVMTVRSDSGMNQVKIVQRRKPSNVVEVHVNKGAKVKVEIT